MRLISKELEAALIRYLDARTQESRDLGEAMADMKSQRKAGEKALTDMLSSAIVVGHGGRGGNA